MPTYSPSITITDEQDAAADALAAAAGMNKAQWLQDAIDRRLDSKIEHDLNNWFASLSVAERKQAKAAYEAL